MITLNKIHYYLVKTDGYTEQLRCVTALYFMSLLDHAFEIVIDISVGWIELSGKQVLDYPYNKKCM